MPQPTNSEVHVDSALTNISVAYIQSSDNFVAGTVFPNLPVMKQADRYFVFDRGDFNRDEAKKRAPGTESSGSGYQLDNTPTYFTDVWAHHQDIPDQVRSNSDAAVDVDRSATTFVTNKLLIRREKNWAATFFTGSVWATTITGVTATPSSSQAIQWSDGVSSDPIGNIRAAITHIEQATGITPNTLVVGKAVMDALEDHPDIVDRVKYSGMSGPSGNPARVNANTLAQLFGLQRVLVMRAVENTAGKELTEVSAFIGGKKALLTYAAPVPSLLEPTGGYTFSWSSYLNAGNEHGIAITRFYMKELKSERVEGEIAMDQKLVSSDLGYFWTSIVA